MDSLVPSPTHIHSATFYGPGAEVGSICQTGAPVSTNWPNANDAIYIPFFMPHFYVIQRFFWGNGATVTGQMSVALYTANCETMIGTSTGAVAQSGASALQYAAPTGGGFWIPPGAYQLGLSCNGTTGLIWASTGGTTGGYRMCGFTKQATAHPLPTNPVPVAFTGQLFPLVGFTRMSSGF